MARADLLCDLIKYGLAHDDKRFIQSAEAVCAEEREKQHTVLANRIEKIVLTAANTKQKSVRNHTIVKSSGLAAQTLFIEKTPERRMGDLVLPEFVRRLCDDLVEEQLRADLLRSYGLEPRHKILLVGAPGNGKTSLAEAVAESLMVPFLTIRYEQLIGSYLGETASRLGQLFDYARTRPCVLFDKAAWRRFQIRFELPPPTRANLSTWLSLFERRNDFDFGIEPETIAKKVYGCSFAEVEELAIEIYRRYVLLLPSSVTKKITNEVLQLWSKQRKQSTPDDGGDK